MITPAVPSGKIKSTLVVVPWLEGGGAQGALENLLRKLPSEQLTLVILFSGSRNHESVKKLVQTTVELNCPRSISGVLTAGKKLRPLLKDATSVYSLMRASHLVLGLLPSAALQGKRLAATFHQLPSQDAAGLQGSLEDLLVRRGVKSAGLITAPAARAVAELIDGKFGTSSNTQLEHNLISFSDRPQAQPRTGNLDCLKLVFAGRITKQKGLDRIPELLAATTTPVHLICLGDGDEKIKISKMVAEIDQPHRVEMVPHVDDTDSYFDWCDAVFMPSRWELNPLVIWEARARGRGAITSNIEVFSDLASSGPTWMFSDASDFSAIVTKLSQDQEERSRAFEYALESIHELDTRSAIVEYLDV